MRSIVITGIGGLIGSNLAHFVKKMYPTCRIIGIDDFSGGYNRNIPEGVDVYTLDLVTDKIDQVFENVDYVFHLAAYAAEGLSPFIRMFNYQSNLVATANVVNACIKHSVKRLVFTSSIAVYGDQEPPFSEDMQPKPMDPYGVAKYACEMDIQIAGIQHGLDWCILRPHNVYGRRQNIWDKYRNVFGIWMYQAINNLPMTIYGDGEQERAFSYIDDIMMPMINAATLRQCSKEIINLGGTKEYTINHANKIFREVSGYDQVSYLEQRHEAKLAYCTFEKSQRLLYYKDSLSLRDGVADMWEWAKNEPNRSQKEWYEYELDKGMYSFWKNT